MKDDFIIDLQLFAEGTEDSGADAGSDAGDTPPEGEPTPVSPNDPQGTILGGEGKQEKPEDNQQAPAGAPSVYDFSSIVPEGMEYDQKSAEEFGAIARECGLSQEQASKVASYGMQFMQSGVQAAMQQLNQTRQQWGDEARQQLGADFDKTVSQAAVAIDRLSVQIPGLRNMLNETGAGNRIEMIQFLSALGSMLGEDGGHGVPGAAGGKSLYPNTNFGQYK